MRLDSLQKAEFVPSSHKPKLVIVTIDQKLEAVENSLHKHFYTAIRLIYYFLSVCVLTMRDSSSTTSSALRSTAVVNMYLDAVLGYYSEYSNNTHSQLFKHTLKQFSKLPPGQLLVVLVSSTCASGLHSVGVQPPLSWAQMPQSDISSAH